MSRFADYVAQHYADPAEVLAAHFADAVAAAASVGALLEAMPDLDGSRHYLPDLKGHNDKRHYYRANLETDKDGTVWPCITFGTFKHGSATAYWKPRDLVWQEFQAANDNQPANDDRRAEYRRRTAELQAKADAAREVREAQAERGRQAAADAAAIAWSAATACAAHAYLSAKGVQSFGLRMATNDHRATLWNDQDGEWQDVFTARAGELLVPMIDATGQLCNLQRIDATGRKRFLMGGRKRGTFHRIEGTGRAWMAEGYATAATVHAATGTAVVVAFDAGNLAEVARQLADQVGTVAADNDANDTGRKAAEATGLPYAMPPAVGDDWNDHAARHSLQEVAQLLTRDTVPASAEPANDNDPRQALPVFTNLASLPRVELAGREQVWFNKLAKETDPLQAAAVAWSICRKRAVTIPTQTTLDELLERIEQAAADRLHPETVATMGRALTRWNNVRHKRALAHVTVSHAVLRRHLHEVHTELPELSAQDYQGVVLLWAPMASGKTQRIGKPFATWAREQERFIATCHRRSLVAEMAERLACDHYGDVTQETAWSVRALATCLPSITKGAHAQIINECAYLFVDEIAQVLRFLESDKTCRTEEGTNADVYQRLRDLVSRARCVIGADAGMDDRVVEFLEACRPGEQFRIIEVRPRNEGLTASTGYGADAVAAVYGEMCARVADGQRIWVSCESEKRVAEIAKLLEATGAKVLAVTASNRGNSKQAAFWQDPEGVSRTYDAVVHSPVISSGLSIEHKQAGAWFDHGYFIGGGHAITPADAAQMMRRVRYLRAWSVALVANTMRGLDDPESMLLGMEAAAAIEGATTTASDFDAFVAGIRADNNSARCDFAAGLLWVLQRAGFALQRMPMHADAPDADELKALRAELDTERRAAIMSASDLTDDEARRMRSAEHRTQEQSDALTKHAIRHALGVDTVTDEALDVWDDGRGPRHLDRFSAAVFGLADRYDDAKHMTQRRFTRARVAAYGYLFDGLEIHPGLRVTDELAEQLIARLIERRHLLAWLGIVPSRFGAFIGNDKDGEQKPFPMPKAPQKDVGEIFRAMGLELKRRQNRHDGTKCYELQDAAYQVVVGWAERRNSHRSGVITLDKYTATVTVSRAEDDAHWLAIRRQLVAQAGQITKQRAEALILAHLNSRGSSYGAKVTAHWFRSVFAERCAA
ncbi:plasmid replication protein, CyRepA1 family [Pseudomonas carassii]|uniref:Plasmid replication protein, CyRepA1 family n=1 Tax=Pseudomonas carassii TaxID=3115855 RepID=A0ABU7H4G9_9PSED|nr:plasmid replication protein, CyRepA1 family [Pseudomonas sp. 137P]MEE1886219.1 plasmid replication protein, CyRepA1 family [Pseudomonas sp. 137P]